MLLQFNFSLIWWIFATSISSTHTHTHTLFSLSFSLGYREGFLWKRGRDNGQFLSRKFILSEREGALKYFNKQDVSVIFQLRWMTFKGKIHWLFVSPSSLKARDPKAVMKIETLNATFQPAKIGNPCGLQITYLKDNSTRNIFVYHSDAKVSLLIVDNLLFKHTYRAMMLIG